jgi:hypothetical protein
MLDPMLMLRHTGRRIGGLQTKDHRGGNVLLSLSISAFTRRLRLWALVMENGGYVVVYLPIHPSWVVHQCQHFPYAYFEIKLRKLE